MIKDAGDAGQIGENITPCFICTYRRDPGCCYDKRGARCPCQGHGNAVMHAPSVTVLFNYTVGCLAWERQSERESLLVHSLLLLARLSSGRTPQVYKRLLK